MPGGAAGCRQAAPSGFLVHQGLDARTPSRHLGACAVGTLGTLGRTATYWPLKRGRLGCCQETGDPSRVQGPSSPLPCSSERRATRGGLTLWAPGTAPGDSHSKE